jgi:hypothetical protein
MPAATLPETHSRTTGYSASDTPDNLLNLLQALMATKENNPCASTFWHHRLPDICTCAGTGALPQPAIK